MAYFIICTKNLLREREREGERERKTEREREREITSHHENKLN